MMKLPCLDDPQWAQQAEQHFVNMDKMLQRIQELLSINNSTITELNDFAAKIKITVDKK